MPLHFRQTQLHCSPAPQTHLHLHYYFQPISEMDSDVHHIQMHMHMHPHNLIHSDELYSRFSYSQYISNKIPVPQTDSDSSSAIQTDLDLPTVSHTASDLPPVLLYLNGSHPHHARLCSLNFSLGYTLQSLTIGKHVAPSQALHLI